jgi:hypothetical protein
MHANARRGGSPTRGKLHRFSPRSGPRPQTESRPADYWTSAGARPTTNRSPPAQVNSDAFHRMAEEYRSAKAQQKDDELKIKQ